jgi:putative transposase
MAYRTEVHFIKAVHPLFQYCSDTCLKSKNLYKHPALGDRRVKRGLFRSATGIKINADVISSYNIIVKAFPNAMQLTRGDRRCALHLVRINIT